MGIGYHGHQSYTVIPTLLGSEFGALGHLWSQHDVITSWLRGCHPIQTASRIHIRHKQHSYAVHRHMVVGLLIYTHPTWLRFW